MDGVLFSKEQKTLYYMPFGRNSQANLSYTFPEGTESVGDAAFYKMSNLAAIKFTNDVKTIGVSAFEGCTSLLSFSFSTSLKNINSRAFFGCSGLQTLTFPEGLEEIGQSAFDLCKALTTVKFGEGLKTIKSYGFASCYALTYVEFPKSLEIIEDRAFWRTILNKVDLPDNLQSLGWQAFSWSNGADDYSKHLQSITIPAKVTKIGSQAFAGYYYDYNNSYETERFSVDTIFVHMAPYVIPTNAFGTLTTTTLVVPKGMRDIYSTTDGWKNIPNVIEGDWEPEYDKSPFVIGSTAIDEGMTIAQSGITYKLYAKEGRQAHLFSELTNYPDNVINLPEQIYYRGNNYSLTGIEKFKSNRVINLVVPNTVTSIQTIKSGVKTLNVPATVTSITDMHESADLQEFKVDADNTTYCDVDGVLFSKDKKTLYYMPYGRRSEENMSVTIADGVETIANYAFNKMTNITRLQTNAELRTIGDGAFQGCTSIATLTLTKGLKKIGAYNFSGCTGLGRLTFPEGLEEIGNNAFDGCTNLARVTFGEGMKIIRTYAFARCYTLTNVEFAKSIEIIEDRAFWRTILNKVDLPDNLQSLGWQAFSWSNGSNDYSKHLQSITIPAKVTKIGNQAFAGYYYDYNNRYETDRFSVDTVYTCVQEPFHINSNAFGTITNTVLMVPRGTKEEYLMYNGWKDFGDRIEEWDVPAPPELICETPKFTRDKDTLTIATATEGASIYYTLNGLDPTDRDLLFDVSNPIVLKENCIVKAIAVKEGLENSAIASLNVNWFTVADVTFKFENLELQMSTETEGAVIRFTLDGTDPTETSTVYQGAAMSFAENCTVKAMATKTNWNNSRITSFEVNYDQWTCLAPTFRLSGSQLIIETSTVGGTIYYTLDKSEPTKEQGTKYEGPVTLSQNCIVKAIVVKDGYRNSPVAEFEASLFTVDLPTFSVNGTTLTISCTTDEAAIYYAIGKDAEPTILYQAAIALTDNQPVRALAKKEGYKDSEIAEYNHSLITCQPALLENYNGRYFTLNVPEGAKAYYTLDGTTPTKTSTEYTGRTTVAGLCTLKTIAIREWMNDSEVKSYDITYFSDGENAEFTTEGQLEKSMEWISTSDIKSLSISGPLNQADLEYIKNNLNKVLHLNLQSATVSGNALPDEAFAGMQMVTFSSPAKINSVGSRILADCPNLAAVIWNSEERMPANTFGEQTNPNMLVYVGNRWNATATNVRNIVVNGIASEIILTDAEGNNNFYCPQAFKAQNISYTHNYSMTTGYGTKAAGWETIALPFTVQKIMHESKGEVIPYLKFEQEGSSENARPFWLRELKNEGFEDVAVLEANTPYIISMPNNSEYAARYNIAGNVIFSAENAEVPVSSDLVLGKKGSVTFVPAFTRQDAQSSIWCINRNEEVEGYAPGSTFVPALRTICPFEAYATNSALQTRGFLTISELSGQNSQTTGIYNMLTGGSRSADGMVKVYSLSGKLVKTGDQLDNVINSLPKGIYIINGKKRIVK